MPWTIIVSLIAVLLSTAPIQARDIDGRYAQSPLKQWFDGIKNKKKELCCSDADGLTLKGVDWDTSDGHYRVRIDGKWVDVPDDAVVIDPNRYGPAVVWPMPYKGPDGETLIRCFMPGVMT